MSITLQNIRQRLMSAGLCNDGIASSATSNGTTTTLIDTSIVNPDDFFNYGQIIMTSGTPSGEIRYISDWVQSTGTFTVSKAFSGAPQSGNGYEAHFVFSVNEKNDAINEAIRRAGTRWMNLKEDTSLTLDDATYEYALAGLSIDRLFGIDEISYATGVAGAPYQRISPRYWDIRDNNGTLTLQFYKIPRDNATMRIRYRVRQGTLTTDATALSIENQDFYNFIVLKAAAILYEQRALKSPDSQYGYQAQSFHQKADTILYEFDASELGHARDERVDFNLQLRQLESRRRK